MRRFLGTCYHTLDDKGRLSIPSRYRKDMGTDVIITRGHEGCLYVWPLDEWEEQAQELLELRQTARDPRNYLRNLAMNADEGKIDSHGRIVISPQLRALAGLERDVIIGGVINHLELWSPKRLEKYWQETGESFEDTSERLYPTHIKAPEPPAGGAEAGSGEAAAKGRAKDTTVGSRGGKSRARKSGKKGGARKSSGKKRG